MTRKIEEKIDFSSNHIRMIRRKVDDNKKRN